MWGRSQSKHSTVSVRDRVRMSHMLPETEVDDNNKYTHKDTHIHTHTPTHTHTGKGSGRGHARLPDQSTSISYMEAGECHWKNYLFFVH